MSRQLIACCISGGIFIISYLVLGLPFLGAFGASAGAYVGGLLLFRTQKKKIISIEMSKPDVAAIEQILSEANTKITTISTLQKKIVKPTVKAALGKVLIIANGIVDDIRNDPSDAKRARQFLNYYLDAVVRIMTSYTDLMDRNINSPEALGAINKVETLLLTLEVAFQKQRDALASNDVLDLDTEISLLDKTLGMEGLKNEG